MNTSGWFRFYRISLILLLVFISACVPYSKIKYLNDINELNEPFFNPIKLRVIAPYNRLNIIVLSTDEQTVNLLNYSGNGRQNITEGYVVDESGTITFPFVGKIEVGGMTLLQASDKLKESISSIITKPEVVVSFINNRVTVLGEFVREGTYTINDDFISIYEAIALGGGLTQFANREQAVLLRRENNKLIHYKLDLTKAKIASDPLYYVLPDDILIVEPLKNKTRGSQGSIISAFTTAISLILSILYITRFTQAN